jgi:hypothetical protein
MSETIISADDLKAYQKQELDDIYKKEKEDYKKENWGKIFRQINDNLRYSPYSNKWLFDFGSVGNENNEDLTVRHSSSLKHTDILLVDEIVEELTKAGYNARFDKSDNLIIVSFD